MLGDCGKALFSLAFSAALLRRFLRERGGFMTLQEGIPGGQYAVEGLDLPMGLERRLEALGLIEGSTVAVLRKKRHGAMIIKVRGTRFAVGWGISRHIRVASV